MRVKNKENTTAISRKELKQYNVINYWLDELTAEGFLKETKAIKRKHILELIKRVNNAGNI